MALIIMLLSLSSCSRGLISQKELPEIIAELYKADRYINNDPMLILMSDTTRIYEAVFNKYGYTTDNFVKTLEHYLSRPRILKGIYVQARVIIEQEDQLLTEYMKQKAREDFLLQPYRAITDSADVIKQRRGRERLLRWILVPASSSGWSIALGDSLQSLYQHPVMSEWWAENFNVQEMNYLYIKDNEKNRRAVPVPDEFIGTVSERGSYIR